MNAHISSVSEENMNLRNHVESCMTSLLAMIDGRNASNVNSCSEMLGGAVSRVGDCRLRVVGGEVRFVDSHGEICSIVVRVDIFPSKCSVAITLYFQNIIRVLWLMPPGKAIYRRQQVCVWCLLLHIVPWGFVLMASGKTDLKMFLLIGPSTYRLVNPTIRKRLGTDLMTNLGAATGEPLS